MNVGTTNFNIWITSFLWVNGWKFQGGCSRTTKTTWVGNYGLRVSLADKLLRMLRKQMKTWDESRRVAGLSFACGQTKNWKHQRAYIHVWPRKATDWYFCVCHLEHCCWIRQQIITQYINIFNMKTMDMTVDYFYQNNDFTTTRAIIFWVYVPPLHSCMATLKFRFQDVDGSARRTPRHYSQLCLEHLNGKAQGAWSKLSLRFLLDFFWNIRVCCVHDFAGKNGSVSEILIFRVILVSIIICGIVFNINIAMIYSCQVRYSTKGVIWYCWVVAVWIKTLQHVVTCVINVWQVFICMIDVMRFFYHMARSELKWCYMLVDLWRDLSRNMFTVKLGSFCCELMDAPWPWPWPSMMHFVIELIAG